MARPRSRKAAVRLEHLEPRIALSVADAPVEIDPPAIEEPKPDVEITAFLASVEDAVPVAVADATDTVADGSEPSESDELIWITSVPVEDVEQLADGDMPVEYAVPLMAQSGLADGETPTDESYRDPNAEILPYARGGGEEVMTITSVSDDSEDPTTDDSEVPLMARTGAPVDPSLQPIRITVDPSVVQVPVTLNVDARPEVQVQILGDSGTSRGTRLMRTRPLSGVVRGEYRLDSTRTANGGGPRYLLNGQGRIGALGTLALTGSLEQDRSVSAGQNDLSGTVRLTDSRGTLTVKLEGSASGLQSKRPVRLNATVVGATGSFQALRGIGPALFRIGPNGFGLSLSLAPPRR